MNEYALHPEAFADLDEIREYIAEDNPDAADRVISEIFDGIGAGVLSRSGISTDQSDHASTAVQASARVCDRLCA